MRIEDGEVGEGNSDEKPWIQTYRGSRLNLKSGLPRFDNSYKYYPNKMKGNCSKKIR